MTTTEDSVDIMRVMVHVVDSEDVSTVVCPIFGVVCRCGPYVSRRDAPGPFVKFTFPSNALACLHIGLSRSVNYEVLSTEK